MRFNPALVGIRRRDFLKNLGGTLASSALSRIASAAAPPALPYPFSEVPASASGIHWTHTSGNSPEKYLPESTGAGCADLLGGSDVAGLVLPGMQPQSGQACVADGQ